MTSDNLESVNAIPRRYLNVDAKIQIDMDNTAEAYLKRGISKKNFLEFVKQIVDMQQKCMENGLHADFDLKQIEVVNEHVLFKVYVGDSGLQIVEIKEYLKTLAYTAVFQGEDFLQTVYEYLSFMDQTGIITLGQIADKIHFWLTGESVQVAPQTVQPVQQQPVSNIQQIPQQQQIQPVPPVVQPIIPDVQPVQQQPIPTMAATMEAARVTTNQLPPVQESTVASPIAPIQNVVSPQPEQSNRYEGQYSQNGETGVLDPAFWNNIMNQGNDEDPNRVRRQNKGASLLYLKTGEKITITKQEFAIGKSRAADYVINDSSISRKHAEITCKNGHYFVTDNASTNGTFVNGRQVPSRTPIEIFQGDLLRFATEEMKFQVVQ